jgi:hypothetical protein
MLKTGLFFFSRWNLQLHMERKVESFHELNLVFIGEMFAFLKHSSVEWNPVDEGPL